MRKFQTEVQITAPNVGLSGLSFGRLSATTAGTPGAAPLGVDASGNVVVATGDVLTLVNGTAPTVALSPVTRRAVGTGVTDSNGRVTVYMTTTGTSAGTAIFSSVLSVQLTGVYAGTDVTAAPHFYVESVSADRKTLIVRGTKGAVLLALGNTVAFVGAGLSVYFEVTGLI